MLEMCVSQWVRQRLATTSTWVTFQKRLAFAATIFTRLELHFNFNKYNKKKYSESRESSVEKENRAQQRASIRMTKVDKEVKLVIEKQEHFNLLVGLCLLCNRCLSFCSTTTKKDQERWGTKGPRSDRTSCSESSPRWAVNSLSYSLLYKWWWRFEVGTGRRLSMIACKR